MPPNTKARLAMRWQLSDSASFRAFIQDYLPEVAWRIPVIEERLKIESLLLELVPAEFILLRLEERRRAECALTQHAR